MDKLMILKPRVSEKTYGLAEARNTYVVDVPGDANKLSVARAIEAQFEVTVKTVNIVNVKGKAKRTVRKGGRPVMGKRSDIKKAYVTLAEGSKLPFFTAIEEAAADEKPAKKAKKEEK